ncbi:MAG: cell division protein FtsX [Campylobacterota bacterium]|nr:cell division protein FtsX [Campylobacterota bacterium]MEA3554699.1 cell division protein FtsX [Campylobacterota bacterium]
MKHLKSFFSFTIPLIIMLITFSIYLLVNKVVDNYKDNITNDYSIMVIANTPMATLDYISGIKVKEIKILEKEKIIKDVKKNLSESSLKLLKNKLPHFYQVYLEEFPTTFKLEQIRKELLTISNVKRVETFSNDHNKIYSLLILIQDIIIVLFAIVLLLSIFLLSQQIKIWFFEQSERISIIQLHGGSLLYSSKPIIKVMILSTLFSIIFVSLFLFFTIDNIAGIIRPELLALLPNMKDLSLEIVQIVVLACIIPLITFFGLLVQHKLK